SRRAGGGGGGGPLARRHGWERLGVRGGRGLRKERGVGPPLPGGERGRSGWGRLAGRRRREQAREQNRGEGGAHGTNVQPAAFLPKPASSGSHSVTTKLGTVATITQVKKCR